MQDIISDLWLRRGEERRLRAGHLWVFSNEVDTERSPLKDYAPGQRVTLREHGGRPLGTGYVNPHSLICARLISRDPERPLDESLLVHRLNIALDLRQRLFDKPYYRLVHGDGDGLSGLVVDRFGDTCVVQINTAGMEQVRDQIVTALQRVVKPRYILLRADSGLRALEGLESYVDWVGGNAPDTLEVEENGCRFRVPASSGQKTGWYYDHRANRARLPNYVRGRKVLDVFSYAGAWGLQALAAGATSATCVDSSSQALDQAAVSAELNNVADALTTVEGDAFTVLQALRDDRQRFDVVIVDPPAFVKRKKDLKNGLAGYRRLNQLAMQVLEKDGMLITASCSSHVSGDELLREVLGAGRHLERSLQVVETGHQAADHPVHPAIAETRYLKAFFCRVLPAWSMP
ncbi:MAG: class I SAM-dependent rRNA methyltransferase [Aquisalimonadaceae bacterium]